ncbi:MAG: tetratricopeptide repeat protein [Ignavibacteriaceae bacterium]
MKTFFILITSVLIISGCSSKSDKEYLKNAEKDVKGNNISEAIESYQTLVDEYPDSKLAPDALYEMAALYQNNLIKNLSKNESLQKSVEIYRSVYDKYPESKKAPMALFMSGFILANELNNYGEASKAYNLFLKKFPNHELSTSAKEELKHLGLSPEEILKEKSATNI